MNDSYVGQIDFANSICWKVIDRRDSSLRVTLEHTLRSRKETESK